jgi:hypothetical protein
VGRRRGGGEEGEHGEEDGGGKEEGCKSRAGGCNDADLNERRRGVKWVLKRGARVRVRRGAASRAAALRAGKKKLGGEDVRSAALC